MAPTATYRLQLTPTFGFRDAAAVVPYLAGLGVSHVYLSPILECTPGSNHGYDVVDHGLLSAERGGYEGWQVLQSALREHGLGCVVDIVPNHMAVPVPQSRNAALWSVLRDGRDAATAHWFDIDWDAGGGKLVLAVLGCGLDEAIGTQQLSRDGDRLRYHEHEFPVAPGTEHLGWPEVVHAQHYVLTHWSNPAQPLNYRRFFDIDDLIALRVEDADVFQQTHRLVLELVHRGDIQGLRVDHVDGLADPAGYVDRLAEAAGDTWLVVEKILAPGETLPAEWPCAGTTGYDALRVLDTVWQDPAGLAELAAVYRRFTGEDRTYPDVEREAKRTVLAQLFTAERDRLLALASGQLPAVDRTLLGEALDELLVAMPVYRTYLEPGRKPDARDCEVLERARRAAAEQRPAAAAAIGEFTASLLDPATTELVVRFQQLSSALTAKGVEDTAGYRWHALVSSCEVGGDPGRRSDDPVAEFHEHAGRMAAAGMTTLSTHDTKRGEDVRARLATLTEVPAARAALVDELQAVDAAVDLPTRYLAWQTRLGAAPIDEERLTAYLRKACREAKLATSWTAPDPGYEAAVEHYARALAADARIDAFAGELRLGWISNLLAQKAVQLTMPGVPDVYQGAEGIHLALVDPDNRRPVDYGALGAVLADADRGQRPPSVRTDDPQRLKVHLTSRLLRLRRDRQDLFTRYQPLPAQGVAARHVLAFSRGGVVAVVPRLPVTLAGAGGFRDTTVALPSGSWTSLFSGTTHAGTVRVEQLLTDLPVAVLTREVSA